MTDLLISQPGFSADVYYHYDQPNERFIVSYIDAPWWNVNSPGYIGSNTFQVILSAADSSITFQYLDVDQVNLLGQAGCDQDLMVGIENLTGDIGLQVYQEVVPPDNYAIKFYYPDPVTYTIKDAGPQWNQNVESKGQFVLAQSNFNLQTGVSNFGNADINSDVELIGSLTDLNGTQVFIDYDTLPNLAAGAINTVVFSESANLAEGQYVFETSTTNAEDINAGNDVLVSEVNAVDMTQGSFVLSYATQQLPTGSVQWQGGDGGVGVYMKPPSYPVYLDSIGVYIADFGGSQNFRMEVYDDDQGENIPGTLLGSEIVSGTSYVTNQWVNVPLTNPIEIDSGGIYIGWIHITGSTIGLGTEQVGPISRQSYEYIGGNWAVYRENEQTELLINGHFTTSCGSFTVNTESIDHVTCFGGDDGSIDVTVTGGSAPYNYSWDNAIGAVEDPIGLGAGVYVLSVTDDEGCSTGTSVTINQAAELSGVADIGAATQGNNGSIDFTASGGTPPYNYEWSTGFTTEDITGIAAGNFSVTVTDDAGCTATFDFDVPDQVGIAELTTIGLDVYPNPNLGEFSIEGDFRHKGQFEVLDMTGRIIGFSSFSRSDRTIIKLEPTTSGFYLLRWVSNNEVGSAQLSVIK